MAVDGSGNAIVVRRRKSLHRRAADVQVLKYAGAGGTLLWSHRYDGAAHWDDSATAVAVDPDGRQRGRRRRHRESTAPASPRSSSPAATGTSLWAHVVPKAEPGGNDAAFGGRDRGQRGPGGRRAVHGRGPTAGARTLRLAGAERRRGVGGAGAAARHPSSGYAPSWHWRSTPPTTRSSRSPGDDRQRRCTVKYAAATGERAWTHVEPGRPALLVRISPGGDRAHPARRPGPGGRCRSWGPATPATHDVTGRSRLSGASWRTRLEGRRARSRRCRRRRAFGTDCPYVLQGDAGRCAEHARARDQGPGGSAFVVRQRLERPRLGQPASARIDAASGAPAWLRQIDGPDGTARSRRRGRRRPGLATSFAAGAAGASGGPDESC